MEKFIVTITETLEREIAIKAKDGFDALEKVRGQYKAGDIVLNSNDFTDVEFSITGPLVKN